MAEISLSLAALFEKTFGYKTQAFDPEFRELDIPPSSSKSGSPYYAVDSLGREYFMPVTFQVPATIPSANPLASPSSTTVPYSLPYPVISVSSKKTIIETPLTERLGSVKELINITRYSFTIKGFIIGNENEFPEDEMTNLRNLFEQNVALEMQCPITDIFLIRPDRSGSDKVVIQELSFPSVTGIKNVRHYEMKLVSDEPFSLESIS